MTISKRVKDHITRKLCGKDFAPQGLVEIQKYFRIYGPIKFEYKQEEESIMAISKNFRYGSIVTSGENWNALDKNIKDAILTAFNIPSSYAKEASIQRMDEKKNKKSEIYALA